MVLEGKTSSQAHWVLDRIFEMSPLSRHFWSLVMFAKVTSNLENNAKLHVFGCTYFIYMNAKQLVMVSVCIGNIDGLLQKDRTHFDGLLQERRNSSALAMALCLFCISQSICESTWVLINSFALNFSYEVSYLKVILKQLPFVYSLFEEPVSSCTVMNQLEVLMCVEVFRRPVFNFLSLGSVK